MKLKAKDLYLRIAIKDGEMWWTDGNILVRGTPPRKAKLSGRIAEIAKSPYVVPHGDGAQALVGVIVAHEYEQAVTLTAPDGVVRLIALRYWDLALDSIPSYEPDHVTWHLYPDLDNGMVQAVEMRVGDKPTAIIMPLAESRQEKERQAEIRNAMELKARTP